MAVLYGVFLYMGVTSLGGVQVIHVTYPVDANIVRLVKRLQSAQSSLHSEYVVKTIIDTPLHNIMHNLLNRLHNYYWYCIYKQ